MQTVNPSNGERTHDHARPRPHRLHLRRRRRPRERPRCPSPAQVHEQGRQARPEPRGGQARGRKGRDHRRRQARGRHASRHRDPPRVRKGQGVAMRDVNLHHLAAPPDYKCHACGVHGVRLWREYQTCAPRLLCRSCAQVDQKCEHRWSKGDQIGWYVPAVPDEEGVGYWGYTSVPIEGCRWWYRLGPDDGAIDRHPEYGMPDRLWVFHLWNEYEKIVEKDWGERIERMFFDQYFAEAVALTNACRMRTGAYRLRGRTYGTKAAMMSAVKAGRASPLRRWHEPARSTT